MRCFRKLPLLMTVLLATAISAFAHNTIPEDQVDATKILWGVPASFEMAGEVDLGRLIRATPEFQKLKADKVEEGTAQFWQLKAKASERVYQAVLEVAEETEYDLIAAEGYLAELDPVIPCEDITDLVLEALE